VYNNTRATVKHQIEQVENPMRAVVISVEAARVDNAILLDYVDSKVTLEEPVIGSTDPNIRLDNNFTDDELNFGMPGGCGEYEDEGDESDDRDAIQSACWWQRPAKQYERIDLGTSDVDGYEGEDGDDADVDKEEDAAQAKDESIQNVQDWPGTQ